MTILAAAGALMMEQTKEAREFLNAATGEYTPALQRFVDSLYILLEPDMAKEMGVDENTCAFYLDNFFGQKDSKAKADEEQFWKEKEEFERKRKDAEDEAMSLLSARKQKVSVPRQWFMAIGDPISYDEIEDYWNCCGQPVFSGMRIEEPTNKIISKFFSSLSRNDDSLVLFHPQKKELIGYSKNSVGILYSISHDTNTYCSRYAITAEAKQTLIDYFSSGHLPNDLEAWQKCSFTDLLSSK